MKGIAMFAVDLDVLQKLIAEPGTIFVASDHIMLVIEGYFWMWPGEFDNMNEEAINKFIREQFK